MGIHNFVYLFYLKIDNNCLLIVMLDIRYKNDNTINDYSK